jgi:hypothetical protein
MFTSRHNLAGGATPHFNNEAITELIQRFQLGDRDALAQIVTSAEKRAKVLIRFNGATQYRSEPELLSDIHFKLVRSVAKFNPARGSAFSYISCLIENELRRGLRA